jgi:hypothetical protein
LCMCTCDVRELERKPEQHRPHFIPYFLTLFSISLAPSCEKLNKLDMTVNFIPLENLAQSIENLKMNVHLQDLCVFDPCMLLAVLFPNPSPFPSPFLCSVSQWLLFPFATYNI